MPFRACNFQHFSLVNVHLIFNFWRELDMHAVQAAMFFRQLYKVLPESAKHSTPWIVCGDFNMKPSFPAYELVKNGQLSESSVEKLRPGKYAYPSLTENKVVSLRQLIEL
jgi:endonuclease/exonuclease/phosphatase family metal-dependent hydrolase